MSAKKQDRISTKSRRRFLQASARCWPHPPAPRPAGPAAESNTVNIALVGCGGRARRAAANALNTRSQGPVRLVAMADV